VADGLCGKEHILEMQKHDRHRSETAERIQLMKANLAYPFG
jgi:hypothetical protein